MRIAIPKGRLFECVMQVLRDSGMHFQIFDPRNYTLETSVSGVSGKIVKVRAIPQLIALQNFDVGFCGLDLVREADYENVIPIFDL